MLLLQDKEASWHSASISDTPDSLTGIHWTHVDGPGPLHAEVLTLWLTCVKECCAILGMELVISTHAPFQYTLLMEALSQLSPGAKAREPNVTSVEAPPATASALASVKNDSSSSSQSSQAASADVTPAAGCITVVARGDNGESTSFKVHQSTSTTRIFEAIGKAFKMSVEDFRVLYEGRRMTSGSTVAACGLQDGDVMDVTLNRTGD